MTVRIKTPRPSIPELPSSSGESYLSDIDSEISNENEKSSWYWEQLEDGHRSSHISGWMCIPKSVVMATALNMKHSRRLDDGKPLTILNDRLKVKRRPLSEKTLAYIQSQKRNIRKTKTLNTDLIANGCYEDFLEEVMTDMSSLKDRFGSITSERYDHYDSSNNKNKNWEKMLRVNEETNQIHTALPQWKRSFLPPSREVQNVKIRIWNSEKIPSSTQSYPVRFQSRPLTADSGLRLESNKASKHARYRPVSSDSTNSFRAMKSLQERKENSPADSKPKLPGYPRRVVRNRARRPVPLCKKRPIMTTRTSWYPLSFRNEMKGNLISLGYDSYGYQNIAEYEELCHSLSDGVVLVEQQMEVGDQFKIKILETDRRLGLLYLGVRDEATEIQPKGDVEKSEQKQTPRNRLLSKEEGFKQWKFSCEIPNLKTGDLLQIVRDSLGQIKSSVNENDDKLLFYLPHETPVDVALCLGLGVTKVQLLGCQRECVDFLRSKKDSDNTPFLGQFSRSSCTFCGALSSSEHVPYPCEHVGLCNDCHNYVECRLCRSPLCWATCPLCDNRLQSY